MHLSSTFGPIVSSVTAESLETLDGVVSVLRSKAADAATVASALERHARQHRADGELYGFLHQLHFRVREFARTVDDAIKAMPEPLKQRIAATAKAA
jgi:hypothetical protein